MKKAGWKPILVIVLCICMVCAGLLAGCSGKYPHDSGSDESNGLQAEESKAAKEMQTEAPSETPVDESELNSQQDPSVNGIIYNYSAMDQVLAAMIYAMSEENMSRFTQDSVDNELVINYIYAYINLYDQKVFSLSDQKGKHHNQYMKVNRRYLEDLLEYTFEGSVQVEDLKADGDLFILDQDAFYVAKDNLKDIRVDYTGLEMKGFAEAVVYTYDYERDLKGGETEDGILQVKFRESLKTEAGIALNAMAVISY